MEWSRRCNRGTYVCMLCCFGASCPLSAVEGSCVQRMSSSKTLSKILEEEACHHTDIHTYCVPTNILHKHTAHVLKDDAVCSQAFEVHEHHACMLASLVPTGHSQLFFFIVCVTCCEERPRL